MDIFDSATPEMKRVRNQRKDSSVLESMMAASEEITPIEWVFNADGVFKNSRDIFGPPSCETSPVNPAGRIGKFIFRYRPPTFQRYYFKSESPQRINVALIFDMAGESIATAPSPKKRKTRKAVLSAVSVNASRLRGSRTKLAVIQSPAKRNPLHHNPSYNPSPIRNTFASFGGNYYQDKEHDEEFRMTAGDGGKKRSFGIFQETPDFSPDRTESPLEEPRYVPSITLGSLSAY
jgi:hypothetical protein